jgi:hypothetical protein
VSSLHVAVAEFNSLKQTRCNIHIDNLTVTLGGLGNDVGISPTAINHIVNELLFKTKLQGKLPDWIIDAFDISLMRCNFRWRDVRNSESFASHSLAAGRILCAASSAS